MEEHTFVLLVPLRVQVTTTASETIARAAAGEALAGYCRHFRMFEDGAMHDVEVEVTRVMNPAPLKVQ